MQSVEHYILIRKPLEKKLTVAKNVLKHGVGGINRVGISDREKDQYKKGFHKTHDANGAHGWDGFSRDELTEAYNNGVEKTPYGRNVVATYNRMIERTKTKKPEPDATQGRFPANFICSGEARDVLDEQSGVSKSSGGGMNNADKFSGGYTAPGVKTIGLGDSGGASRFYYNGIGKHNNDSNYLGGCMLLHGDCLEQLKTLDDNSIDSLVTDPPAGIAFMGKDWDKDKGGRDGWVTWMAEVMVEAKRVMKPGAHGFVWALPRTSHWTATALEDAGFEIRDVVMHVFGSGFPKSHNVSKALDKLADAERSKVMVPTKKGNHAQQAGNIALGASGMTDISVSISPAAKQWDGWGTALKPAAEHWVLVRKPLDKGKTVAKNVLEHGTGGINVDASRVEQISHDKDLHRGRNNGADRSATVGNYGVNKNAVECPPNTQGRFPANFICSGEARELLDEQSGDRPTSFRKNGSNARGDKGGTPFGNNTRPAIIFDDKGGASRFFYCAKASKRERNEGCGDMPSVEYASKQQNSGDNHLGNPRVSVPEAQNHHPTVKPQKLMQYLVTMITPPGGVVLDPFMGSGSTGVAAVNLGHEFIGIEQDDEYIEIARARIKYKDTSSQRQLPLD